MPRGITRKDYTLLRDGEASNTLFGDEESGRKPQGATVWRLFGLARQEIWVGAFMDKVTCSALHCSNTGVMQPPGYAGHCVGNTCIGIGVPMHNCCSKAGRGSD